MTAELLPVQENQNQTTVSDLVLLRLQEMHDKATSLLSTLNEANDSSGFQSDVKYIEIRLAQAIKARIIHNRNKPLH